DPSWGSGVHAGGGGCRVFRCQHTALLPLRGKKAGGGDYCDDASGSSGDADSVAGGGGWGRGEADRRAQVASGSPALALEKAQGCVAEPTAHVPGKDDFRGCATLKSFVSIGRNRGI